MRVFPDVIQGSPDWHELRRGLPTCSGFKCILTPGGKLSTSARKYAARLAADVANLSPTWFSEDEGRNKPPSRAMRNGQAAEPEARAWFQMERECHVIQVGGILSPCGRFWCSPDGIVVSDAGTFSGGLELKCPLLETQAERVVDGFGHEFRPQVHGGLVVAGGDLPLWTLLSYASGLPPVLEDVRPDEYTAALKEELEKFWGLYTETLQKCGLTSRFADLRASILAHFPPETQ